MWPFFVKFAIAGLSGFDTLFSATNKVAVLSKVLAD